MQLANMPVQEQDVAELLVGRTETSNRDQLIDMDIKIPEILIHDTLVDSQLIDEHQPMMEDCQDKQELVGITHGMLYLLYSYS